MPRKSYDPLAVIPSPDAIRERLRETLSLADRLRILLELAEQLRVSLTTADRLPDCGSTKGKGDNPNE